MRQWFSKLMYGRYGGDNLGRFLSFVALVPLFVSLLVDGVASVILWLVTLALLVWMYVRMFSRNISARSRENQKYLQYRTRLTGFFRGARNRFRQRKEYRFFRCPNATHGCAYPAAAGNSV